jgi:hypothetical protein
MLAAVLLIVLMAVMIAAIAGSLVARPYLRGDPELGGDYVPTSRQAR